MAGIAGLAKEMGHVVAGCDANAYPPMSDALIELGIDICEGYDSQALLTFKPDLVIVGNALSRGNSCIETLLSAKLPFTSGPQWLADYVLRQRTVLAVAGTHGKTTTASILSWILNATGNNPGYLIGGIANNFARSAALGTGSYFVIEADEYDSAFFDKRPKFLHYYPQVLIANNLEFDHADIYSDLSAIELQFQYLLRTISSQGEIIVPQADSALSRCIQQGCWSKVTYFGDGAEWSAEGLAADASEFVIYREKQKLATVHWPMFGSHNMNNALAAIIAATKVGVSIADAAACLKDFQGIKRRLEVRGVANGVTVYDDFAHHPTAIAKTIEALRRRVGQQRILAVIHFASNSMSAGAHLTGIAKTIVQADWIICANAPSFISHEFSDYQQPLKMVNDTETIIKLIVEEARPSDHVLIMSNKGFDNIHEKLLLRLNNN